MVSQHKIQNGFSLGRGFFLVENNEREKHFSKYHIFLFNVGHLLPKPTKIKVSKYLTL